MRLLLLLLGFISLASAEILAAQDTDTLAAQDKEFEELLLNMERYITGLTADELRQLQLDAAAAKSATPPASVAGATTDVGAVGNSASEAGGTSTTAKCESAPSGSSAELKPRKSTDYAKRPASDRPTEISPGGPSEDNSRVGSNAATPSHRGSTASAEIISATEDVANPIGRQEKQKLRTFQKIIRLPLLQRIPLFRAKENIPIIFRIFDCVRGFFKSWGLSRVPKEVTAAPSNAPTAVTPEREPDNGGHIVPFPNRNAERLALEAEREKLQNEPK